MIVVYLQIFLQGLMQRLDQCQLVNVTVKQPSPPAMCRYLDACRIWMTSPFLQRDSEKQLDIFYSRRVDRQIVMVGYFNYSQLSFGHDCPALGSQSIACGTISRPCLEVYSRKSVSAGIVNSIFNSQCYIL